MMVMVSGIVAAWREVRAIVIALVGASALAFLFRSRGLALFLSTLLAGVFYFFRDPERSPVALSPELILAPADGKVTDIEIIDEPTFFKGPVQRISIFLSLFDVHVQRAPYQAKVEFIHYQPGDFAPAFLKDTHSNEFNFIGFSTSYGPIAIKQIAGILARRIVCWSKPGDILARGERLGLVKFGSRVDLLVSQNAQVFVKIGQQVYGGKTIMGRWTE